MTLIRPTTASRPSNSWRHPPSERKDRHDAWRQALAAAEDGPETHQHLAPRTPSEPLVLWPLLLEDTEDAPPAVGPEAEAYGERLRVTFAPPAPGSRYDGWA